MKTSPNDIVIQSWAELCEKVYEDSWKRDLGRFRSDYAYRGVSNVDYPLKNGFIRNCGNNARLEYHLLRNFRKYAQVNDRSLLSNEWRVMTLGQHYGLPTRMIDWTYSPFIAIHFATVNTEQYQHDGAIWQVDFVKVNHYLPDPLRQVLLEIGANTFTIEMIEEVVPSLKDFDNLSPDPMVMFFEPPSMDHRIVNQYAFFSVMSNPISIMDDWLLAHPDIYRRIIIPKELKWEIRDKIDQANITERMLFPGLDGLAKWLKRHYAPSGNYLQRKPLSQPGRL